MTDAALSFLMGMGAGAAVLAIALILIGGALLRAASAEIDRTMFPNKPKPRSDEETARTVEERTEAWAKAWNTRPGMRAKLESADHLVLKDRIRALRREVLDSSLPGEEWLAKIEELAGLEDLTRRAQR